MRSSEIWRGAVALGFVAVPTSKAQGFSISFGAGGYVIHLLAQPAYVREIASEGPWDVDDLFRRFPLEMGHELRPSPFRWPGLDR